MTGAIQVGYGRARETADDLRRGGERAYAETRRRGRAIADEAAERGRHYRDEAVHRGRAVANRAATLLIVAAAAFGLGLAMRRGR